jgi:hypothetical protein
VNKDSYLILEALPAEYDSRVKAMEVDERPTEQYADIGGLDKQIQEVRRLAAVLAMRSLREACADPPCSWWRPSFCQSRTKIASGRSVSSRPRVSPRVGCSGSRALSSSGSVLNSNLFLPVLCWAHSDSPGVLMYGPPGTGKTLMARACAAQCKATFLKLAGPQLVQVAPSFFVCFKSPFATLSLQMYIGDGARLVRDAFTLAKEKAPSIIFIDELDAVGTKVCGASICQPSDLFIRVLKFLFYKFHKWQNHSLWLLKLAALRQRQGR